MEDEKFMERCLDLAIRGAGKTAPNPMVGAVLVHQGRIIGEGYHRIFGGPHAEVNCIRSVSTEYAGLIGGSTLYVSLEPCNHFGKTPPCTGLIIEKGIRQVVIGCRDLSAQVNGRGIAALKEAGIHVMEGVAEKKACFINRRFFTFHQKKRPYVILKWAQSLSGTIAAEGQRTKISNETSDRLVHKWRSEEAAILVGTNTAVIDNPQLTSRLWPGKDPVRIVIDKSLRIPLTHHLFDGSAETWIFNFLKEGQSGSVRYFKAAADTDLLRFIMETLFRNNILSVLVEGGSETLRSFLNQGLWDEARVITNRQLILPEGVRAPVLGSLVPEIQEDYQSDRLEYFFNDLQQAEHVRN